MDVVMKQREVFFNNLLILGFDKASVEKEYRTTCDRNMFCVPNQKMFEVVTYFLFSKLNQVSNPKYSIPWPLMDKDQHRQFQKSCFNHLSNIAQESNVKFPRIVSSLLSTFSGDRFYELYLAFSTHVLQRTIIKKDNVSLVMTPTVFHQNKQDIVDTLKIATVLSVENFQEVQSFSLNHFKLLFRCARQYVAQIQYLKQSLTTNRSLLEENISTLKNLYSDNQSEKSTMSTIAKKSLKYEQKVKDLWLPFENFLTKESKLWSCLCSEVEGNHEKHILDGADFRHNISDNIKKSCPELNEVGEMKTSENEKLNLFKYLKSFYILLQFYMKTTVKGELLQVNDLCFDKNTSSLEESLKLIQSLNEHLVTNILPRIKDSKQKLEDNSISKDSSEDLEIFLKECPFLSCCSKTFQENTASFRSEKCSTYTDDIINSSLLTCDISMSSSEDFANKNKFHVPSNSSEGQTDLYPTNNFSSPEIHSCNALVTIEALKDSNDFTENSFKANDSFGLNATNSNIQKDLLQNSLIDPSITHTNHPQPFSSENLGDFIVDIDCRKPFKLRESWQNEESLNAMTLEDLSELE